MHGVVFLQYLSDAAIRLVYVTTCNHHILSEGKCVDPHTTYTSETNVTGSGTQMFDRVLAPQLFIDYGGVKPENIFVHRPQGLPTPNTMAPRQQQQHASILPALA